MTDWSEINELAEENGFELRVCDAGIDIWGREVFSCWIVDGGGSRGLSNYDEILKERISEEEFKEKIKEILNNNKN
ncbi:TPA_asm: hypothetical protein [Altiarchaeum virus]|nr:TPA_asm: hypothetical protein [Altiarchaeum virus]